MTSDSLCLTIVISPKKDCQLSEQYWTIVITVPHFLTAFRVLCLSFITVNPVSNDW